MKYCPECQAGVEGLVYRCDCCGASLEKEKKRFFNCGIYELPQCLGFSSLVREMVDALQPANPKKYQTFLEKIGISMVCYPEWMLEDGNIKNQLRYSAVKKYASLTIIVNYNDFVCADREEKASLIAVSLLRGIHLLQTRLRKQNFSIDGLVTQADTILNKYIR